MRRLLLAAACVLLLVSALPAAAGDVTGRDKAGDVKTAGLTKAEKGALDLVSVRAIGEEGFGVVIVATFSGDVTKTFGRGHLKNALAAMILHPKTAALNPAGLVTRGAGQGTALRKTRSTAVDVIRDGRTVTFIVSGPGYSNVGRIEVKSFASFVLGAKRFTAQAEPGGISDQDFRRLVRQRGGDVITVLVNSEALTCDERRRLAGILAEAVTDAVLFKLGPRREFLKGLLDKLEESLQKPPCSEEEPSAPVTGTNFRWSTFSPNEVAGTGTFRGRAGTQISAVRVTVPPSGSQQRVITNYLSRQFPTARLESPNTIVLSGGILGIDQTLNLNLQTFPVPTTGMGGEISAQVGTTFYGPFPISGP